MLSHTLLEISRGSRFKDRKIDIRDFVEMIFKFRKSEFETRYSVPSSYRGSIVNITPEIKKKKKEKVVDKRYGFGLSSYKRITPQNIDKKGIIWAKDCRVLDGDKEKILPGLNMQYPYAGYLVDGIKTIETRVWRLNENLLNKEIAIIETPGKLGKKNGVTKSRIIGIVKFNEIKVYNSERNWASDREFHKCDFALDGSDY